MGFTRGSGSGGRRQTEEGFNVYSPEELKLGGGGGTRLCPWDCNCCFG